MTVAAEIAEQPSVLARLVGPGHPGVARAAAAIASSGVRFVLIAARGSSDNAARYAQYLWGARNGLPVALAAPSLFTSYRRPPSVEGAAVAAISQSGRSPDLVAVIEAGRAAGRPTVVITNDPGSPLASAGEHVLDLDAGPEGSVAATKTYTAQLAAVALLSAELASDNAMAQELRTVPELVGGVLRASDRIRTLAGEHAEVDRCAVLGRGYNLATAFEWALKLQELGRVGAMPFSIADFEHGPIALADPTFPVLAVAPAGPFGADVERVLREVAVRGAPVLAVADPGVDAGPSATRIDLPAGLPEWLSPIVATVVAQLFVIHLCVARGLDPDAPRGLAKVTRTW